MIVRLPEVVAKGESGGQTANLGFWGYHGFCCYLDSDLQLVICERNSLGRRAKRILGRQQNCSWQIALLCWSLLAIADVTRRQHCDLVSAVCPCRQSSYFGMGDQVWHPELT